MQPSSLIFLVIIAIWAAYFIQYWVRRREHLATARSVDRFSESMRVLERRSPLPESDLSVPQPRSYAVSPARAARPQVVVKRAANAAPEQVSPIALDEAPAVASGRRTRGLAFLGSVAVLLLAIGLAAFSVIPWLVLFAPVAAVAGVMVWMRHGAETERAARRELAETRRVERGVASRLSADPQFDAEQVERAGALEHAGVSSSRSAGWGPSQDQASEDQPSEDQPSQGQPTAERRASREELYDVQAAERSLVQSAAPSTPAVPTGPLVDEDDIPLTWDPVPVPRPTYTMKAKARRPEPAPAEVAAAPQAADPAYDEAPVRRVVGG